MAAPPAEAPADLWRRLMSVVYEAVILFGIVFFFGYAFSAVTSFRGGDGPLRTAFQLYLFLVLGVYFVWFWSKGRRTLPMKTMGVTLVQAANGRPLGYGRAAWRYLLASVLFWGLLGFTWKSSPLWLLVLPVPFLWALGNRRRQTLYDQLAGTLLVRRDAAPALRSPSDRAAT